MPITKQNLSPSVERNFVVNLRMAQKLNKALAVLNQDSSPENDELRRNLDTVNAGIALLMFRGPFDDMPDDRYDDLMKAFDKLPTFLFTKIHPGDKTPMDLILDGLDSKQAEQASKEIQEFYKTYELSITKTSEERSKELNEKREAEIKQVQLEENGDPSEVIPTFTEKQKTGKQWTAAEYIEKHIKDTSAYHTFNEGKCSELMAARLLADSDRGSADKLKSKKVYTSEVSLTARWLRQNIDFSDFFKKNRKKIYDAVSARGHGGGVDDLFKSYIKKLPAGQMPTRALYSRYMPTALERIDVLKKQIKSGKADLNAAAAEIAVLRNLVKAEKGSKNTLNRKLTPEQMVKLKEQTELLSKDPTFTEMLKDQKAIDLVTSGHGGDFLDHIRKSEKNYPNMNKDALAVLNGSSLGTHLEDIKKKALDLEKEIQDELVRYGNADPDKRSMTETWKKVEESKKLLAEYIACDNISRKPVKGTVSIEQRLLEDAPLSKISEQIGKRDKNQVFKNITKDISPDKAMKILNAIGTKKPDEVISGLAENERILPEEPKAPVSQNNLNKSNVVEQTNIINM